jgi:hypothetical protein
MRGSSVTGALKLTAGVALAVSMLLPLYSLPAVDGSRTTTYAWQLALDAWADAGVLALAFLWPILPAILRRNARSAARRVAALVLEPALAVFSANLIIAASFSLTFFPVFPPWFMIPVAGKAGAAVTLGVAANGLYLLAWIAGIAGLVAKRWTKGQSPTPACC